MAFFKKKEVSNTTGDPFLDAVVSIDSDYTTNFSSVSAIRNSDVFTAIKIIASDIASSPIQLFEKEIPNNDDDVVKIFNEKANNETDGWHLKFALAVNMLLNGNSFAEIKRNGSRVESIDLLPNSSVTLSQNDNGTLHYYLGAKKREIKPENMLHFKYFTQDGLTGLSPLYALRDEMKIQKAGNKTWFNFYTRGVNGSGILKVNNSNLDQEAMTNLRETFEKANGSDGGNNALRTIILDSTMEYKTLEVNTDVLKLVNSSDWTTRQIAKCFGIPTERLGVENQHSSTTQSNLLYIQSTLVHYFNCFSSELKSKFGKVYRFNTDYLLESDPQEKIKNVLSQIQGSVLTINEGRARLGLSEVDGGDRLLTSLNYTYLDSLEKYQFKEMEEENGTRKTSE